MITSTFRVASRRLLGAALVAALPLAAGAVAARPAPAQKAPAAAAPKAGAAKARATAASKTPAKTAKKTAAKKTAAKRPARALAPTPVVPALPRSEAAERVIAWVAAAQDNAGLPYAVIDKPAATLYLFAADGHFLGEAPVLLGIGIGDDSSPGVGAKNLDEIGPAERTTPAGRFVAKFGRAFGRQRVLWVDYANNVALHAVTSITKKERRVERLLSPSPEDNRISFGCINVGSRFYTGKLRPQFERKGGIVYVLPDVKPLDDVFPRVRLLPYLAAANAGGATMEADR
ncbi:hypothetical protein [Sphingomonas sp. BK235]|uniref:hypothetical protein n=1 Tax=Sphingomonas sp. BK235 TaxID=2512131 RepID=UPI0010454FF9|nr:hypothetical protein [Sphingomonas sp. BK235]TCP35068.1 hypothetical protein EV292_103499 [Sphingomonas sp. BK235]